MASTVLLFTGTALAQPEYESTTGSATIHTRCTVDHFKTLARGYYLPWYSPKGHTRRGLYVCKVRAGGSEARRLMRRFHISVAQDRAESIAYYHALTPYGRWAIPGWCVMAESGGSWSAQNPTSPARGAYQLLSHGEPWPVDSMADKIDHHEIAASLYAAGGLSPWVACS